MLKHRIISGSILIVSLLSILWFDNWLEGLSGPEGSRQVPPGLALLALTLLIVPLAARELAIIFSAMQGRALSPSEQRGRGIATGIAAVSGLVLSYLIHVVPGDFSTGDGAAMLVTALLLIFIGSVVFERRTNTMKDIVASAIGLAFAFVYLGLLLGLFLALRKDHSAWWLLGIIFITKSADIGAYFTGKAIGKHKLIPWLSPGKTWEGLGGGLVFACFVGMGFAMLSRSLENPSDHAPLWFGLVCGASFTIAGLLGDLHMSLLKRSAGLKDSSTILPGLGGVLDVLDSLLFVAPVAYWLVRLLP